MRNRTHAPPDAPPRRPPVSRPRGLHRRPGRRRRLRRGTFLTRPRCRELKTRRRDGRCSGKHHLRTCAQSRSREAGRKRRAFSGEHFVSASDGLRRRSRGNGTCLRSGSWLRRTHTPGNEQRRSGPGDARGRRPCRRWIAAEVCGQQCAIRPKRLPVQDDLPGSARARLRRRHKIGELPHRS